LRSCKADVENARGDIVQLYPNSYGSAGAQTLIQPNAVFKLPQAGAAYSFKVLPPTGPGRLVAIVVPQGGSLDRKVSGSSLLARGLQTEPSSTAYSINLAQQLIQTKAASLTEHQNTSPWAATVLEYSIQP
jgi:hypothetical protein